MSALRRGAVLAVLADAPVAADPGRRFVAVRIRLADAGGAAWRGTPANGAVLVLADGGETGPSPADAATPGWFPAEIAPGSPRDGWISFAVPEDAVPAALRIALEPGAPAGEWRLG